MAGAGPDLVLVARRQKLLIWMFLGLVLANAIPFMLPALRASPLPLEVVLVGGALLQLALLLAILVGYVLLLAAMRAHVVVIVLCALLMLVPLANLLLLLFANRRATKMLKDVGVRVGFMGCRIEDVQRAVSPWACKSCGYNLTGNVSGRCPECGVETGALAAGLTAASSAYRS